MLAYVFVLFAVAVRFLPHPLSVSPVGASLLFFGARGSRRQIWVPLLLLAALDVILTKVIYAYPFFLDHFVTWVWYAAILWLSTKLDRKPRPLSVLGAALASSVSFFLVSNFAAWAAWVDTYPRNLSGVIMSYAAGLPFFRRGLEGVIVITASMFATRAALLAMSPALSKMPDDQIKTAKLSLTHNSKTVSRRSHLAA